MSNKFLAFLLALTFFVVGVITLPDYGINWDTINHLPRGQAYLHYFLTGKKDYSDLPEWQAYWQNPDSLGIDTDISKSEVPRRSLYQSNATTFKWFLEHDGAGHPPLSDILASVFNRVLFGNLRLVNDIDAYRVYGIFLAAALIGLVFWWGNESYGKATGFFAALSLALYPLFWSESHFNIEKDIPEAVYWSFFLYFIWKGFIKRSFKWFILSGIFFGLALGTKFNIIFSIPIIAIWLIFYFGKKLVKKENLRLVLYGGVTILIGIVIFYASWPLLWRDMVGGTLKIFGFYQSIGTTVSGGFNSYPVYWILFTTPIPILILSLAGFLLILFGKNNGKNLAGVLFILWLTIPILRVVVPRSNIYGGVRQIMEFVPAMALVSGVGAGKLYNLLRKKLGSTATFGIVFLPFIVIALQLYRIHPNENAYFNELIGGLSGARARNISYAGNTFGAAYRQGISWVNKNAPEWSKLTFAFELMPNVPSMWVRPDIKFHNTRRSGFVRDGEYAITLTYQGTSTRSYYDSYLEKFLDPVYEAVVDGVAVVKVWKNDEEHTIDEYKTQREIRNVAWDISPGVIIADVGNSASLSYLDISLSSLPNCKRVKNGSVYLSVDSMSWQKMKDPLPTGQISIYGVQPSNERLLYSFLADSARYTKIEYSPEDSCLGSFGGGKVYELSK